MRKSKFLGVYSKVTPKTSPRSKKQCYFVWEVDKNIYAAQQLNEAFIPQESPQLVSESRLQTGYRLEPGILAAPITTPDFRQIIAREAVKKPQAAELTDSTLAKLEKARKVKQVEADMRDNFAKALRALSRPRDRKGALIALEQMASAKNGISPAHRHMFRDFGVSLRKKSLPELALKYAGRVLELSPNDDHAHFNIARILTLLGLYDQAQIHLDKAREIDKNEKIYNRFQKYLTELRNS